MMLFLKQFIFEKTDENSDADLSVLANVIEDLYNFISEHFPGTNLYTKIVNLVEIKSTDNFFNIAKDIIEYGDEGFFSLITENAYIKNLTVSKNYSGLPSEIEKERFFAQDKKSNYFIPFITGTKLPNKIYQFKFEKYDLVEFKSKKKENSYVRFAKNQAPIVYYIDISAQETIQEFLTKILEQINS